MIGPGFIVAAWLVSTTSPGACSLSLEVSNHLSQTNPGWSVVKESDLSEDDRMLWGQYHKGYCPGYSEVKFRKSEIYYAISLFKAESANKYRQKTFICRKYKHEYICNLLTSVTDGSLYVIWKTTPGVYVDKLSGKKVPIDGESLIFEKMESISSQFYWKKGEVHRLLASE